MDFTTANHLLENVRDHLEGGSIEDALHWLSELRLGLPKPKKENQPSAFSMRSIAQKPSSGKRVWKKVRPGKLDKPGEPTHVQFKSVLKAWKERRESGGDDTPEALGGFLHRHFGPRNFTHQKVMKIAMKAHGKGKEFARRVADHYVAMNKGRQTPSEPQPQPSLGAPKVK